MAKIKHTKNELKSQREALARFERFLPMLQLKKQQLQAQIQAITTQLREKQREAQEQRDALASWIRLLSDNVDIDALVSVDAVDIDEGNIAGVTIPALREVTITRHPADLFRSPPWVDDAADVLEALLRLDIECEILAEQRRRITEELRTTSQRVNLFEKVKIPECRENIRIIKIFLGDEQTAAVVRGKFAKKKTGARQRAAA